MKPVVIIAIVAVAIIGVMYPDVLGTKYVNESPYEFSIDYPYGWQVDGIQEVDSAQDFIENGVAIFKAAVINIGTQSNSLPIP